MSEGLIDLDDPIPTRRTGCRDAGKPIKHPPWASVR